MKKPVNGSVPTPIVCPASARTANTIRRKAFGPPTWPEAVALASSSPSVTRRANRLAYEYGVEAGDLLQAACCRALSYPPPCSAQVRLINCMGSIAWTMLRDRRKNYTLTDVPSDEEFALNSRSLKPDEQAQRSWTDWIVYSGFAAIAGNDNAVGRFIDVFCDGHRGHEAQARLGLSRKEFETVKRRAQRKIRKHFEPLTRDGKLELDWFLSAVGYEGG